MIIPPTITSIDDVVRFLEKTHGLHFAIESQKEAYGFTQTALLALSYFRLKKAEKGIVREYLVHMTGYSRAQITRLIRAQKTKGCIEKQEYARHSFPTRYTHKDIVLLAKTDELHDYPNGVSLKQTLVRMYSVFGKTEYEHISRVSPAQIYVFRNSMVYQKVTKRYEKTQARKSTLGERRKPTPNGRPGYIRVDTVHQGDEEGEKGMYHIHIVDEVTQFDFVGAVEHISEAYLLPLLEILLALFPFVLVEFHSDNGGEFINKLVAKLLNRLLIKLTKSRSRKTTDNALIEGKNGSIIRKWIGYEFMPKGFAKEVNIFYFTCFHEYVNYHRVAAFATETRDAKGKVKKVYKAQDYMTPYDKLKNLPVVKQYLKPEMSINDLDEIAKRYTDNEMAEIVQEKRRILFDKLSKA